MGLSSLGASFWRRLRSARKAKTPASNPSPWWCFFRYPGRRVCHHVGCAGDSIAVQGQLENVRADSCAAPEQLKNAQQIHATYAAFVAALGDAPRRHMGQCSLWWRQKQCATPAEALGLDPSLRQSCCQYPAPWVRCDLGRCMTWGDVWYGGNSGLAQDQLKKVQEIQALEQAFAAIGGDRSVIG